MKEINKKLREVKKAMKALGFTDTESVDLKEMDETVSKVFYHGRAFGIYDFVKHTFVD